MPVIKCPFPGCDFEVKEDVPDDCKSSVLNIHLVYHQQTHASINSGKAIKLSRPILAAENSTEDWIYFVTRWDSYKSATKLQGAEVTAHLLECCDEALRKDLSRVHRNSLPAMDEVNLLKAIKRLAVIEESTLVSRYNLHNMKQDIDEPIRSFVARIKGQAHICKLFVPCPNCEFEQVDFSDQIVRDVVTRGLNDEDIRLNLLGDKNQDMSLEETIAFIEAKESGKKSAGRLLNDNSTAAALSQYKSRKKQASVVKCNWCGKRERHGSDFKERQRKCPAFKHMCEVCHITGHFASVCRRKTSSQASKNQPIPRGTPAETSENAIFDVLCAFENINNTVLVDSCSSSEDLGSLSSELGYDIPIEHHVHNKVLGTWERKPSDPQPTITMSLSISSSAYEKLGIQAPPATSTKVTAITDTGCQSCLAGIGVLSMLGLETKHLIKSTMKMKSADEKIIPIYGALFLTFKSLPNVKPAVETKQMVYFTGQCNKLYLSKGACLQLGLVPESFPAIGDCLPNKATQSEVSAFSALTSNCTCPKRQDPPPLPTRLPYSATEKNRKKLNDYLLKYYSTSTFNTCTHQYLPMMSGEKLRLHIDDNAVPVAYHRPIPVPLHWQEDVKEGLDQDVRLGVIEPVPVGEPVTWCHRMVICPKKNGKPRRTVDFQPLNRYASRETHHTQSPYLQARSVPTNTLKTVFDAWNGYHSVPLDERDRHYTTFITPWGRYRYCVAPQGYISSGDAYTRRFDEIVAHVPNKTKCVDDTLLWSSTIEESFFQAAQWLDLCGRNGITLNPDKFQFAKETAEFAGFEISKSTVRPCPSLFEAIQNFPAPENITDLRSWYGLINQVSYNFASAKVMQPFRNLLSPSIKFTWTDELNDAFIKSKRQIISEITRGVEIFNKKLPTCLATDWSQKGVGFWLFQKHCSCQPGKPFCCKTG